MFWNRSARQVIAHWQAKIEHNLETGQQPLLNLGLSNTTLDNLQAWSALQRLASARTDMTRPTILVGGDSAIWLATFMHTRPQAPERSPNLFVAYTGSDRATYMASLTTQHISYVPLSQRRPAELPPAVTDFFAPLTQPAVSSTWDVLPFVAVDRIFVQKTLALQSTAQQQQKRPQWFAQLPADYISLGREPLMAPDNDWLAWATIALVFVLFLAALIL